jgi:hypothetical protein
MQSNRAGFLRTHHRNITYVSIKVLKELNIDWLAAANNDVYGSAALYLNIQDPGDRGAVLRIRDVKPGSRIRTFPNQVPDPTITKKRRGEN